MAFRSHPWSLAVPTLVIALAVVGACGGDFTYDVPSAGAGGTNLTSTGGADAVSVIGSGGGGSTASNPSDPQTSTGDAAASGASTSAGPTSASSAESSSSSSSSVSVAASSGSGDGIQCVTCAQANCPAAVACLNDPACVNGSNCAKQKCLNVNSMLDYACALACFNNNAEAAKKAVDASVCIASKCASDCAGVI